MVMIGMSGSFDKHQSIYVVSALPLPNYASSNSAGSFSVQTSAYTSLDMHALSMKKFSNVQPRKSLNELFGE